jgi:DNA-binding SARP family transcriptional activator
MSKIRPAFEIRLFGMPQLVLNGNIVNGIRRKNCALLYYLAAENGQSSREKLITFFWPDYDRSASQPILRTMIHQIRSVLDESFITDDRTVALSSDTFIDVQEFSKSINSPSSEIKTLTEALNLYTGDFLEGFSLANSPQFDDWATTERERYQLMAMNGYSKLAHLHEVRRNYSIALESMQRALAFNPFQEELQRDVMRLLYLNGDRAGVIRQYETLRRLLIEEMGVPPMPETRALYDSIINDTFIAPRVESAGQISIASKVPENPLLPFLGREAELEVLKAQLGSGKLILLEGEPGIGKTRLLSEFIASQTQGKDSVCILQGISYELEQGFPYHPIVAALRRLMAHHDSKALFVQLNLDTIWLGELTRLLPELLTLFPYISTPTEPIDELRLWEALLRLFQGLSQLWEVWFVLDDLQWADAATIAWLGYLIRNISSPSFNILTTSQPLEGQNNLTKLLQVLKREDRLVRIQLFALPKSAIQKMAGLISQRYNEQLSNWLITNTEGNPFFINELIRYAYGVGLLKKDGVVDQDLFHLLPAVPATIQNLIQSRLLKLSDNARKMLHVSAIIGREFDFELVKQVASFSETDTLDAVEELEAAQLIKPLPESCFAFDHYLTMQVSLTDMDETRRLSLHRRVAETLESIYRDDLDPVSGLIAYHFKEANHPDRATVYAFRAGKFAANLAAWVEALAFYRQALELEQEDEKRIPTLLAMGTAHFHKGDFALATKDYQSAVEFAGASQDLPRLEEAYLGLSLSLYPQARFAEAVEMAKELRQSGPPELAPCAEFVWGASLGVESAHPVEAEHHLREAERLLHEQKLAFVSKVTPVQIKYSLAGAFGQQGQSLKAIEQFRETLDIMDHSDDKLDILRNIMLYNNLAYHLHLVGDPSAEMYLEKGIKLAQERGSLSHLPYLYSTSGEIALAQGDLDTAEKYFSDGLALAKQIPIPERIAGMTANLGLVAKQRGDLVLACKQLKTALELVKPLGNHHLEVRIRIWLVPLLSSSEARECLKSARILAEQDGLKGLLSQIGELEKNLQ